MPSKTVIAKYSANGDEFEIFVDSALAYEFITGKLTNPMAPLQVEEVFKDANKGERQNQEKIRKTFGTDDISKIAEIILKKGNVPITTEQKAKLAEDKRKQIVSIIARNSIDPRTSAPHTAQRIENAMNEAKVSIDPFKSANDQVESILKKIEIIIPIKFANVRIEVQIGPQYANRCYGTLKQYGIKNEKWLSDGSFSATLEFPAGLQTEFFDKINSMTSGTAITKRIEEGKK
jgi:ribosome maturation protein SDO1